MFCICLSTVPFTAPKHKVEITLLGRGPGHKTGANLTKASRVQSYSDKYKFAYDQE